MHATPNPLQLAPGLKCSRLSPEQCEQFHAACLQILERTGVRLYDQEAIDLLKKAGLAFDDNRVRIPARLVEWAMSTAPKNVTLYNRCGEPVMPLGGYRSFYGTGSDCLNIVDHRTGERRKPVLQDVVNGAILGDALPNVDFLMSMFLPTDVSGDIADRYQMEIMLNHSIKPIVYVTYDFGGCLDVVAMAEAVAGGAEALAARPTIACYVNVTTGLRHNEEALQKLLYLSGKNLPFVYIPGGSGGLTGPITPAGNMAIRNAGALAGLVISQLKREGAPIIMPGYADTSLDMQTMIMPYCEPEHRGGMAAVSHFYDLPQFTTAGVSDAKLPDQQASIEAALTLLVDALTGGNIVHDMGYLETGLSGSLAQLVICDEVLSWIKSFTAPMVIDDETLPLDLIDEVGPDGQFLDTDHTYRHYKERWYPKVFERDNYENWVAKGGKTMGERASERVDKILATHKPQPLPADVAQAVHNVVEQVVARYAV